MTTGTQPTSTVIIRGESGATRLPLGTIWHPWQTLENAYATAHEFLEAFVIHGAGHWREAPLAQQRTLAVANLPRVSTEMDALEAASQDPDALTDAIEAAVKAAVQALADPHRSAAMELLGYTIESRGRGKHQREIRAAKCLRKSDRWLRGPSQEYGGLAPRTWLLSQVAEQLAIDPDRPIHPPIESVPDQSEIEVERQVASVSATDPSAYDPATTDPAEPDNAKVWPSFPYERVCQQMAAARSQIRILQTWLPDTAPLVRGIAEAVRHGASVEIIIQHPQAAALADRLTTLGIRNPDYGYYHAVKLFADLRNVINDADPAQVSVRTCEVSPSGQLYATENSLWFGFFWPDRYSLQGPQVEVSTRGSHLGRTSSEYFEKLWSSATPLVADDLRPEQH